MAVDVFSETDNLHLIPFALLRTFDFYPVEDIYDDNLKDVHGGIHKLTLDTSGRSSSVYTSTPHTLSERYLARYFLLLVN